MTEEWKDCLTIESMRQQLSTSQKREVTLRKLIGEIYCSDDSSAEVTRKIEDVLNAISSYSKESTHSFEDWHNSHAKYMEPADIIHWCRDAYNAGVIAVQTELEAERNRRFEGNRISSQEYNDCQKQLAAALAAIKVKDSLLENLIAQYSAPIKAGYEKILAIQPDDSALKMGLDKAWQRDPDQ